MLPNPGWNWFTTRQKAFCCICLTHPKVCKSLNLPEGNSKSVSNPPEDGFNSLRLPCALFHRECDDFPRTTQAVSPPKRLNGTVETILTATPFSALPIPEPARPRHDASRHLTSQQSPKRLSALNRSFPHLPKAATILRQSMSQPLESRSPIEWFQVRVTLLSFMVRKPRSRFRVCIFFTLNKLSDPSKQFHPSGLR